MSRKYKKLFKIAAPDYTNSGKLKFTPIARVGKFVPFGYKEHPEDPQVLLPVEKELELFEQAKDHAKHYSLRDVAHWLSENSGRYISHTGFSMRLKSEQKRSKDYIQSKRIIFDLVSAYKKARRFEDSRLGKREPTEEELHDELFQEIDKIIDGSIRT